MKRELQLWLLEHKPTFVLCAILLSLTAALAAPRLGIIFTFSLTLIGGARILCRAMRYN